MKKIMKEKFIKFFHISKKKIMKAIIFLLNNLLNKHNQTMEKYYLKIK